MSKVAVIGAGRWGKNLVRAFYELGALAAVAETSPVIREQMATMYPDVTFYESYHLLLQSDITAVVIATPAATHYAIAGEALLAGKDVFVEKPLTLSVTEAEELHRMSNRLGRILMVGHLLLYQPAIQWICHYLNSCELGELHSIHQRRGQLGRLRSVENVLWSLGVHDIAVLLQLAGDHPHRIVTNSQRVLQNQIEDDVYLHMIFPNGVQAHLHSTWLWPQKERRMIIIGSQGMLTYDEIGQTVTLHKKGILHDLSERDEGSEVVFQGEKEEPVKREASHFLECISTRSTPLSNGAHGVAVIRVLEEANRMMKEGTLR
jgi:predicted dehydrogenase